ncbi:acetyl-CoA hydrolase/transferase C-terminal domain-containing protein [Nocardioides sp. S5]|uniref:acetyl-CoA hydrolase/transferase C-terminal domain-containing protein n=1 Tax=Nocardioides sp. S5 TaxID=2017486 RepID=UPI001F5D543F|nr:acetyl-CoA hydrolase/transferase C-terminal domain-containing protein [Nocardioides sp. S5]
MHETNRAPLELSLPGRTEVTDEFGRLAATLVRPGDSLQFSPGGVGDAFLRALDVPVRIDSGTAGDADVDLDARGLILDSPLATYLAGSGVVYRWADTRRILARVEHTHNLTRLANQELVAMSTALEIDLTGQVNVEGFGADVIAGVGGHPDYAGAAVQAIDGLSVVALPTVRGGRRTLVDRLSTPTSTTRSDVDVVVTENGIADLRGLSDAERTRALRSIWGSDPS